MRELTSVEAHDVSGSGALAVLLVVGGVAAWAFANRADLLEIGQSAKNRHEALNAEH